MGHLAGVEANPVGQVEGGLARHLSRWMGAVLLDAGELERIRLWTSGSQFSPEPNAEGPS
jgi:hypothetical protein